MSEADCDPRTWAREGTWTTEAEDVALGRTKTFGRRFFAGVFSEFPSLSIRVTFLRWSLQADDVYAVFTLPGGGFGVQIDPDLDYVIVWGPGGQAEYGDWNGDQVPAAMDHVRRIMAGMGE